MTLNSLPELDDRVCLKGSAGVKGVVKFCGEVAGTLGGLWIGIDWDDQSRGKHNGSFCGTQYFEARTQNSGSFVRPDALIYGTDLILEITKKYADDFNPSPTEETRWEFVELEKVYNQQRYIFDLKCIVLSYTSVSHVSSLRTRFEKCTELDLTGTLVAKWTKLCEILSHFPKLKTLHLSNTRIEPLLLGMDFSSYLIPPLIQLSLNSAFVLVETANNITSIFENLEEIYLAFNNLSSYSPIRGYNSLAKIDLQGNNISNIEHISALQFLPRLEFLNISECGLWGIHFPHDVQVFPSLKTLFIQKNPISEWKAIDELARLPLLNKLVIKGSQLTSTKSVDVRELIIAMIPNLVDLDRCDVSEVERRSAELYVLRRLGGQNSLEDVHKKTIERLERIHGVIYDKKSNENGASQTPGFVVDSRKIWLQFGDKKVQRNLSLLLSIHRIVGIASKLLDFDPDEIDEVALNRKGLRPEKLKRTRDDLLSRFDLENGDSIVFLANE